MSNFKEKLAKCETMKQIFNLVNENYDTSAPLGMVGGSLVKSKIPDIIKMLNLKPRN